MPTFEVRLKANGRILSRHYKNIRTQDQAAQRAKKLGIGRILSVKKVHASDIIGTVESMGLKDIIGVQPKYYMPQDGIVFENTTIGDVVFPKKKVQREKRRHYEKKKRITLEE